MLIAICHGAGLDDCASCKRLAERNPQAAADPYQAWIPPAETEQCSYWIHDASASKDAAA